MERASRLLGVLYLIELVAHLTLLSLLISGSFWVVELWFIGYPVLFFASAAVMGNAALRKDRDVWAFDLASAMRLFGALFLWSGTDIGGGPGVGALSLDTAVLLVMLLVLVGQLTVFERLEGQMYAN